MSPDRIRIGVIGCGMIAQVMHLHYLRELDDRFDLAAVCDISPGTVQAAAARFGVPCATTNVQDLLEQPLDAVMVLTAGSHAPFALAALRRGLHAFVEKPLCFTLAEADELIEAARANGRVLQVGYMKRFDPAYQRLQTLLPLIGPLRYVSIQVLHPREERYLEHYPLSLVRDVPSEVLAPLRTADDQRLHEALGDAPDWLKQSYSGAMIGSMIHGLNAVRGLCGEPQEILFADVWDRGERIETTFRLANGVRCHFAWLWLPDYLDYFEEIALFGDHGRLRLQFPSPYLRSAPTLLIHEAMEDGAAVEKRYTVAFDEAFKRELVHFHRSIVEDRTPLTCGEDGRADIAFFLNMVAAYRRRES